MSIGTSSWHTDVAITKIEYGFVREVLVELDLPYELRSTGKGSPRREELRALSGKTTAPYLVDEATGTKMPESADIVAYLYETYG